jgi:hypothetical protein
MSLTKKGMNKGSHSGGRQLGKAQEGSILRFIFRGLPPSLCFFGLKYVTGWMAMQCAGGDYIQHASIRTALQI